MVGWWGCEPGSRRSQGIPLESLKPSQNTESRDGGIDGLHVKPKKGGAAGVNSGGQKLEWGLDDRMETGGEHSLYSEQGAGKRCIVVLYV